MYRHFDGNFHRTGAVGCKKDLLVGWRKGDQSVATGTDGVIGGVGEDAVFHHLQLFHQRRPKPGMPVAQ